MRSVLPLFARGFDLLQTCTCYLGPFRSKTLFSLLERYSLCSMLPYICMSAYAAYLMVGILEYEFARYESS